VVRRARWLSAACALLAAVALAVWLNQSDPTPRKHLYTPTPVAGPPPPAIAIAPVAVVRSRPKSPAKQLSSFVFTGPKFTINANLCTMANIRPYDPPGDEHHNVCWVTGGYGGPPGSLDRTTFLFGHAWAEDSREVLNKASALATREFLGAKPIQMRSVPPDADYVPFHSTTQVFPVMSLNGYKIILTTAHATSTYQVGSAYGVRKNLLGDVASWENTRVPKRLVLTTCAELNGVDYDYNVIINADLISTVSR